MNRIDTNLPAIAAAQRNLGVMYAIGEGSEKASDNFTSVVENA